MTEKRKKKVLWAACKVAGCENPAISRGSTRCFNCAQAIHAARRRRSNLAEHAARHRRLAANYELAIKEGKGK